MITTDFIQLISNSPAPMALVDDQMRVVYANEAAKKLYPNLSFADGLVQMLPSQAINEYKETIQAKEPISVYDSTLSISGNILSFSSLSDELTMVNFLTAGTQYPGMQSVGATRSVAALSGHFRTPLSNIFGMVGLVSQKLHSEGEYSLDKYLSEISQNTYLLLRQFVNLSEVIKYQACLPEPNQKVIDLWSLLRGALESAAALTKSIGIPLEFSLPDEPFPFLCDSERFLCALFNIISNSCRFTKENNRILVSGSVSENCAIVTITDNGLGIPAKYVGQAFEPFFSYDPDGTPFAGTGLGLSVARQVITSYGGSINISSNELEGTSVAFTLPKSNEGIPANSVVCEHGVDYLRNRFSPLYIGMCQCCSGPVL